MDPLSNRNRKNILSLNHGTWAVPPVVTGMATAQVHRHLPRDAAAGGQQLQMLPNHQQSQQQQQQLAQPQHPAMAVFGQPQDSHRRGSQHHQHQHLDGLPKAFVAAMRTLFDIMDDRETGFVRLADIEDRWLDDGSKGMPSGVIDSLRKVTPPNGLLSFERFCGGLKMCLVRNQPLPGGGGVPTAVPSPSLSPPHSAVSSPADGKPSMAATLGKLSLSTRPPSAPLLDLDGGAGGAGHGHGLGLPKVSLGPPWSSGNTSGVATGLNTATVRPNNAMPAQKTLSMPQLLSPDDDLEPPPIILPGAYGPPKPPRVSLNLERAQQKQQQQQPHHHHLHHVTPGTGIDKAEIRNALQNWQMSLLMGEANEKQGGGSTEKGHGLRSLTATGRGSADGQTDLSTSSPSLQSINQLDGSLARSGTILPGAMYPKKTAAGGSAGGGGGRRREPRRHTLQNGVDYNMLKRLKQIEQEKDILVQGLTAIEQTRDWYLKQLATVQEKIRYLGRPGSHMETWTETQQERLDLQRARVLEVNRHLMMLAESWERGGFPMHMNLALRPLPGAHGSPYQHHHHPSHQRRTQAQPSPAAVPPAVPPPPSAASYQPSPSATQQQQQHHHHHHHAHQPGPEVVNHLKQQNHQLVEEVNQKNEKLSLLEREKAALIRELLQLQRANRAASMISNTEEEMVF